MNKIHNHEKTRSFVYFAHRQNEINEKFLEYVDHATNLNKIENQICRKLNDVNVFANVKSFDV